MAVVINEFEVVAEPPTKSEGAAKQDAKDRKDKLAPLDVERALRQCLERQARIRAH